MSSTHCFIGIVVYTHQLGLLDVSSTQGGFHKAIYTLRLKFALCAHLFSLILHHVFAPQAQLIAFSPKIECTLGFTPSLNFYEIHSRRRELQLVQS
jgi:hypothetical protein